MRLAIASEKKGGRKKASEAMPQLENNFKAIVTDHTAGDPLREDIIWTYLSSTEIARQLDRLTIALQLTLRQEAT